jgi:PAS domain S-box-containing protein
MNPYSAPSFICLLVMPFLGTFIFSRNPKSPVHRLFFILTTTIAYWAFAEFNIRQAESYETAFFWTRAGCFKILLSPLLIHFILVYIDKWKDHNRLTLIGLIYCPALLLVALDLFFGIIDGAPVRETWGWSVGKPANPMPIVFYFTWKIIAIAFVTKESISFMKTCKRHERKSFCLMFYGILAAVALGIASTFTASIIRPEFPELSIPVSLLFSFYLTFIIWKYNLFLAPSDTADDVIELMGDCLILTDTHYRIIRVNRALFQLTGYTDREVIDKHVSLLMDDASFQLLNEGKGESIDSDEARLISKEGRSIPVLLSRTIIYNNGNMPLASVIVAKDLTFWHKSQEEFARAEKLESFEFIIRSIVHDFNNLLASISGNLYIAEKSGMLPESIKKNLANAGNAAYVAANLTRRLSSYAKENVLDKSICNIGGIIDESAELVLKGTSIRFELISEKDLWTVNVDRYRMVQVFINLFINARQAMCDTGEITVRCVNQTDDLRKETVKINMYDDGGGIPASIIDRVFEPFFTTKPQGSGLGLSIVKSIVESHDGTVTVESQQDIGTIFTIRLPKASAEKETATAVNPHGEGIPPGKILVMDDDNSLRSIFSLIIGQFGHKVENAKNGSEAIELLMNAKANRSPFDCVILDLIVTNGTGALQAIKRIHEIDPTIKAILTSGDIDHPAMNDHKRYGFDFVLKKPFGFSDVQSALATVLGYKIAG